MPRWTSSSVRVSMEEVASSRMRTGGIGHGGAGDGQQLPLALAEVGPVAGEHGVVALRQAADEAVGVGQLGRGDALLVRGVQTAVADVFHNGAGEEVGIL